MSPENARLFIVEDDPDSREGLAEYLERSGHKVVVIATDMKKATEVIPTLLKEKVQVALVDGNLGEGASNTDGQVIAEAIHEQAPGIAVIGIPTFGEITGADFNCNKGEITVLLDTIKGINQAH